MIDATGSVNLNSYRKLVLAMNKLSSISDLDVLYQFICDAAADIVDAKMTWLLFPNQANSLLDIKASSFRNGSELQSLSISIDGSLEGWVYQNRKPILLNDLDQYDHSKGDFISLKDLDIRSVLILPAMNEGSRAFILEVINKNGNFTLIDQEILYSFVSHAKICIDNLHRRLQSDLLPELVHELRTPLAALNTALHLLQRLDLPNERREHVARMIQIEFNRLADLTSSFLDYSRLESGKEKYKLTHFDLNELINDSLEIMQMQFTNKDMKVSVDLKSTPLNILADRDKIKQVVLNLLNNAVKYNDVGGCVCIKSGTSPTYIWFSIQDNGQGILPEYLPHLFERFYRIPSAERQPQGTGLGLTICKHIIEAHNGKIDVSSSPGQGSTFTVQLPIK